MNLQNYSGNCSSDTKNTTVITPLQVIVWGQYLSIQPTPKVSEWVFDLHNAVALSFFFFF